MLNDVRDITIAKNGVVALVSYENKARAACLAPYILYIDVMFRLPLNSGDWSWSKIERIAQSPLRG